MTSPNLPTNIDSTYADNGADASVKVHQQAHDTIHGIINRFDTSVNGFVNNADIGYDLVMLLGQSNMSGRGTAYDLTRYDPIDRRILQYGASGTYANLISQAVEPLAMVDTPTGIGPGSVFARWYLNSVPPNRSVLLIPSAFTGSALSSTSTQAWRRGVSGNLYASALTQTQAALTAAGANSRVVAALWLQGESDSDSVQYKADLDALILGLRTDLGIATLPFVIGQMVPEGIAIRSGAVAIDAVHSAVATRINRTAYATGPTGMQNGDNLHYNAPGQRVLGKSMFLAYRTILAGTSGTPSTPAQVTGLATSSITSTGLTLTWTGLTTASSYLVEYKASASGTWLTFGTSGIPSQVITGLSSGVGYDFRVSATNTAGTGTVSSTVSATTSGGSTAPGQVSGLTAGTPTATTVPLSWTAPSTGGSAITDYIVQYRVTGAGSWSTFADGTSTTAAATVTGLTASTGYDFQVAAVNAIGTGTYSTTATATTGATPTAPAQVTGLTLGTATSTTQPLTWTAPATGGSAITDYLVEYKASASGTWLTFADGTSTTAATSVTGLTAATAYDYRVSAINAIGTGTASSTASGSTASGTTAPAQVTGLTLGTATSTTQPLTWTAPSNGGSAITDYLVEYKATSSGTWLTFADGTSTTAATTVTGLTASTSYDYRVSAINAIGTGTASATGTGSTAAGGTDAFAVAGAAQAYSLSRKIYSAYSGPAFKVRRSSDSTLLDIGFSGSAVDTAALLAFCGAGDGFINTLYDQSGNARHLTQATTAAQPTVVLAGAAITSGGKLAMTTDGTDDVIYNSTPVLYAAGSATTFGVLKAANPSTAKRWWCESTTLGSADQYGLAQVQASTGVLSPLVSVTGPDGYTGVNGTATVLNSTIRQVSATDSGTAMNQWVDGAADLSGQPITYSRVGSRAVSDRFAIGGMVRGGSLAGLAMTFSEFVSWTSVLNTTNRQLVEASQKTFYGTP